MNGRFKITLSFRESRLGSDIRIHVLIVCWNKYNNKKGSLVGAVVF